MLDPYEGRTAGAVKEEVRSIRTSTWPREISHSSGGGGSQASTSTRPYRAIWNKAVKVRRYEWPLLIKMSFMLGGILILQRLLSLPELIALCDGKPRRRSRGRIDRDRLAYLVTGLVRTTLRDRFCMKRSILLFHFLRTMGENVHLHFGFARNEGAVRGHAWVEVDGEPFAEWEDPRRLYASTYSYPPTRDR